MNRFTKHYFLLIVAVLVTVLNGCENEIPSSTYPEKKAWHTVFSDNFNREDGELGEGWIVDSGSNATLTLSDNTALYTTTSAIDNTVVCYKENSLNSKKFRIKVSFKTDSSFAGIESAGFCFETNTASDKSFSLTLNKSYFAIGVTDKSTNGTVFPASKSVDLSDNSVYTLVLNVDGKTATGTIENSGSETVYTLTTQIDEHTSWSSYILLISKSSSTTLHFDDYSAEIYY